jgi:hypothetical protein
LPTSIRASKIIPKSANTIRRSDFGIVTRNGKGLQRFRVQPFFISRRFETWGHLSRDETGP